MTPNDIEFLAKSIALKIQRDVSRRYGFENTWNELTTIEQRQITEDWKDIIEESLDTALNNNY